ncbi:hypothetical protein RCL_jg29174.t1 [Rhizophagus clarus]|uniref:Uncharacterized protein n=1 Tax=Rhizophagus clarus TaxID=94130 RepID=A0A8H3M3T9_9GLOM|nr:hypothetical protein RCL_jg29174.t1 [Rhizophagus clarus]
MQVFLTISKYNKFYIYKSPTSQYQRFCNAFGYYRIVNTGNSAYPKKKIKSKIREYLATPVSVQGFMQINQSRPGPSQHLKSTQTNQVPQRPIEEIIVANFTLPPNASV